MEKIHNKLIRDKIPEIIKADGKECFIRSLDQEEYYKTLQEKLQEELNEYYQSDKMEELADILEIIHAILDFKNMDYQELEKIRIEKQKARGGFKKRLFLMKVIE